MKPTFALTFRSGQASADPSRNQVFSGRVTRSVFAKESLGVSTWFPSPIPKTNNVRRAKLSNKLNPVNPRTLPSLLVGLLEFDRLISGSLYTQHETVLKMGSLGPALASCPACDAETLRTRLFCLGDEVRQRLLAKVADEGVSGQGRSRRPRQASRRDRASSKERVGQLTVADAV